LNPIERIWQPIKQELSWGIYENLDEIKENWSLDGSRLKARLDFNLRTAMVAGEEL
jgi:hypothetical protein